MFDIGDALHCLSTYVGQVQLWSASGTKKLVDEGNWYHINGIVLELVQTHRSDLHARHDALVGILT